MTNRTYPPGVPCWVDTEQPDVEAATAFYGGIFGWTYDEAMPPGAPGRYVIAKLDGQDVGAIAGPRGRVPRRGAPTFPSTTPMPQRSGWCLLAPRCDRRRPTRGRAAESHYLPVPIGLLTRFAPDDHAEPGVHICIRNPGPQVVHDQHGHAAGSTSCDRPRSQALMTAL